MFEFGYLASRVRRALLMAVVLVISLCAYSAQAEGQGRGMRQHGDGVERELNMLTQVLTLTGDQQAKVKTLLIERRNKIQSLRSGGGQPDWDQVKVIRQDTNFKIAGLLTDDQKTKLAEWLEQRKEQRHGRGGQTAPGSAPATAPQPPSS